MGHCKLYFRTVRFFGGRSQSSLAKKEKVKEQSLIRAYESIKKLEKFGIKAI
jgi:hypothetical protein